MTYNVPGVILCAIGVTGIITTLLYPSIKNLFNRESEYDKGFRLACMLDDLEKKKREYSTLQLQTPEDVKTKQKLIKSLDSEISRIKKFFKIR